MQLAVYISNTPVTVKQIQDHQTHKDNVDLKQGIMQSLKYLALIMSQKKKEKKKKSHPPGNMSIVSL